MNLDEIDEKMVDEYFRVLMRQSEKAMISGGLVNPFLLIHYAQKPDGNNIDYDIAYLEAFGMDNEHIHDFVDRARSAGRNMAENDQWPFIVMFAAPGHAERLSVRDIDRLAEIEKEMEERMRQSDDPDDTVMTAMLVVDGRQRANITTFCKPADGGMVVDKRHRMDDNTEFALSARVNVFELCSAVFEGAQDWLRENEPDDGD